MKRQLIQKSKREILSKSDDGFDSVRFELPSYKIIDKEGNYTDEEIELFRTVVECGAPSFFRWAREGGIKIVKMEKTLSKF